MIAKRDFREIVAMEKLFNHFDVYDITKAETGMVAYEKALEQRFDIVILDVNMPIMGGIEAGKKIYKHYCKREERKCESSYSSCTVSNNKVFMIYAVTPNPTRMIEKDARKANFFDTL